MSKAYHVFLSDDDLDHLRTARNLIDLLLETDAPDKCPQSICTLVEGIIENVQPVCYNNCKV